MLIYIATNNSTNKSYIGQTIVGLKKRQKDHIYQSYQGRSKFHSAIREYGKDVFSWEILHECNDKDFLDRLEIFYVGYYDTYNNGYNSTPGGRDAPIPSWMKHKPIDLPKKEKLMPKTEYLKMFVSEEAEARFKDLKACLPTNVKNSQVIDLCIKLAHTYFTEPQLNIEYSMIKEEFKKRKKVVSEPKVYKCKLTSKKTGKGYNSRYY